MDQILDGLERELLSLGKTKDEIKPFKEKMVMFLRMSDANQHANIARNLPLPPSGGDRSRLDNIHKATSNLLKAIRPATKNSELRMRLKKITESDWDDIHRLVSMLEGIVNEAIIYQSACPPGYVEEEHYRPYQLRPEYRGKNVTKHIDVERLTLLHAALGMYFPEIHWARDQTERDAFFRLARELLGKNPVRAVNRCIDILEGKFDKD